MSKHLFFFVAAFAIGCVAALSARAVWFKPYVDHSGHPATPEYSPMVTNPAAPATDPHAEHKATEIPAPPPVSEAVPAPAVDPHANHSEATTRATVNDHCTICGMPVDSTVPPVMYQGKLVGFGCRLCPPKFAADPDRYGPIALQNKVLTN